MKKEAGECDAEIPMIMMVVVGKWRENIYSREVRIWTLSFSTFESYQTPPRLIVITMITGLFSVSNQLSGVISSLIINIVIMDYYYLQ